MAKPTRYTDALIKEYRDKGFWDPITLSGLWDRNAQNFPDREAVVDSRLRLTWAQAKQWTDRIALGFHEYGLKRDDVVVLQLINSVELCLARVACEKAGMLCLPVLRTLRDKDMEYTLKYTEASGVVIPDTFKGVNYPEMIERIRPSAPSLGKIFVAGENIPPWAVSFREMIQNPPKDKAYEDFLEEVRYGHMEVSLLNPTTGTTGLPKFAEYPICARLTIGKCFIEALDISKDDTLGALSPAPGGPNTPVYFAAPWVGAKVVFLERFQAEDALKMIERERVTIACLVPAQMALMLRSPDFDRYNLDSVRVWLCIGAPLPFKLGKEIEERTKGVVTNSYGGVDFGGMLASSPRDSIEVRVRTAGKPRAGTEIKIVDETGQSVSEGEVGHVWGRGPSCTSGYYKDPERTWKSWSKDGWFNTGDLGKFDEEGNLLIIGREKDVIIRGGWNIYPDEIESILLTQSKVEEVAIVGMPDFVLGEKICAYVVPKPGQKCTLEELVSFLKEKDVPSYKLPERLELIDEMPKLAEGQKVDKRRLREDIARKVDAEETQE